MFLLASSLLRKHLHHPNWVLCLSLALSLHLFLSLPLSLSHSFFSLSSSIYLSISFPCLSCSLSLHIILMTSPFFLFLSHSSSLLFIHSLTHSFLLSDHVSPFTLSISPFSHSCYVHFCRLKLCQFTNASTFQISFSSLKRFCLFCVWATKFKWKCTKLNCGIYRSHVVIFCLDSTTLYPIH